MYIGSIKSILGHAEAAAGLTSIAKMIISIEDGCIPGTIHYDETRKTIPCLHDGSVIVVTQNMKWPKKPILAGKFFSY